MQNFESANSDFKLIFDGNLDIVFTNDKKIIGLLRLMIFYLAQIW